MQIVKPTKEALSLAIALAGHSTAGKTRSAIRLARGLVGPKGKIGLIDTEAGRSAIHVSATAFDVIHLAPPYAPAAYIEALRIFEDAGYGAVIVDSASHEWEGQGGVCDMAEQQKNARGQSLQGLAKWLRPKVEHKRFIRELLHTRMHTISCLRAKREYEQRKVDGREQILFKGWREVQDKDFLYEMTIAATLQNGGYPLPGAKVPGELTDLFQEDSQITEATGETIAAWLGSRPRDLDHERLLRDATDASASGLEALRSFWTKLPIAEQMHLKPSMEHLKAAAKEVDEVALAAGVHDAASAREMESRLENPFGRQAAE